MFAWLGTSDGPHQRQLAPRIKAADGKASTQRSFSMHLCCSFGLEAISCGMRDGRGVSAVTPKRTLLPPTFKKKHAQDIVLCLAAPHGEVRLVVFVARRRSQTLWACQLSFAFSIDGCAIAFATSLGSLQSLSTTAVASCCPACCAAMDGATSCRARTLGEQLALAPPTGSSFSRSFAITPPLGISITSLAATRASSFKSSSWHTAPSRLICRSIDRICPVVSRRETSSSSLAPRRSSLWSSLTALPAGSSSSSLTRSLAVSTRWRSSVARMVNDQAP